MLQDEQAKDAEITRLRERLSIFEAPPASLIITVSTPGATPTRNPTNVSDNRETSILHTLSSRCGKAPPVESFAGEESSVHWGDW